MNLKENIRIAVYSIKTNLLRSFLTMLGIIIGIASVITIITVGDSGKDYIIYMIKSIGGQSVNISVRSSNANDKDYITDDDISAIRNIDTVNDASPLVIKFSKINTLTKSGLGILMGTNDDFDDIMNSQFVYGRYFTGEEYTSQKNVAVIDRETAQTFFGTENAVGRTIDFSIDKELFTLKIVGVMKIKSSDSTDNMSSFSSVLQSFGFSSSNSSMGRVYVPASMLKAVGACTKYDSCYITTKNVTDLDSAGQAAINLLSARHSNLNRDVYKATNLASMIDVLDSVINIFTIFISSVGAISLLVGGIGVMNIMFVSVTERTREIGIRKALGARTSNIMFQFLTEAVIICLIGGIVGMLLGFLLSYGISWYMKVPMRVQASTVLIAVGFSTAIGIFFGIYPARKAAKMTPIEALRRE